MSEYVRVATFEGNDAALEALIGEISSLNAPPEGVPAKRVIVLADRSAGKILVVARFGSEEDLRKGTETLNAMSPPETGMRRTAVDAYEVVFEREVS